MTADRNWIARNLGPEATSVVSKDLIAAPEADGVDLRREIIDFDSETAEGQSTLLAVAPKASHGLSKFVDLAWPTGLAPRPATRLKATQSLPACDVLVVTWTADEGHALSRVLTPGYDSRDDWIPYTKNYENLAKEMLPTCPARMHGSEFLGTYWTAKIGPRKVTLFKMNSHMSQDGPQIPNVKVWRQIIADASPHLVITTGTGGGIGDDVEVGDVIVSRRLSFSCRREFSFFDNLSFRSKTATSAANFAAARRLFDPNAQYLPKMNTRAPRIFTGRSRADGIVTTDYFGFDTIANTYRLQGLGRLSEMGDALLGMVCAEIGDKAPAYVGIRNVSDPQIGAVGSIREQSAAAARIYKAFGRWSTVCSAITCWAIIASWG